MHSLEWLSFISAHGIRMPASQMTTKIALAPFFASFAPLREING